MAQPHNKASSFSVHIEEEGAFLRVYLQRHPISGATFAKHSSQRFSDPASASIYADELAETHGDLAVVHH